jgi:hypothetical protein
MSAGDELIKAANLIVSLCAEKAALEREVADLKERKADLKERKDDDWDALKLRVEEAERERNEFQGALLRVKYALGWPPEAVWAKKMDEDVIKDMVDCARHCLAEKNNLEFKLKEIEEIINGSDS